MGYGFEGARQSAQITAYLRRNSDSTTDVTEILGDDFLCSLPDGSLIDRAAFLDRIAHAPAMADLLVHDVNIRVLGDVAIVHARTSFSHPDGTPGSGRYTDVWARRGGHWLAVAAQFSRR